MTPTPLPASLESCTTCGPATKTRKGPQLNTEQTDDTQAVYDCPPKKQGGCGLTHIVSRKRFAKKGGK